MSTYFVLDCSVAIVWGLKDETSKYADEVLESLASGTAWVPLLWWTEICNILIVAQRRNRINERDCLQFLNLLQVLPIKVEVEPAPSPEKLVLLCREHQLTAYDGT